jgi:hypothetical protein
MLVGRYALGSALCPLLLEPHRAPCARQVPSGCAGNHSAHPSPSRAAGTSAESWSTTAMGSPFFAGRESELRALIYKSDRVPLDRQLRWAACRGIDPDAFHPDEGRPDDAVSRAASTAKLALPASRSRCEPKSLTRVMAGTAVLARTTALLSPRPLAWRLRIIPYLIGPFKRLASRPTAGRSKPSPTNSAAPAEPSSGTYVSPHDGRLSVGGRSQR